MRDTNVEVLLVEDNPDDVIALERLATRGRVPVTLNVVRDGQAALDCLLGPWRGLGAAGIRTPRLVLLDIGLPAVHGIEVLRRVRADRALRDVPIVLLSASSDERWVREGQELGAQGHLVKPLGLREFAWIVTSIDRYWSRLSRLPPGEA